jgi:hypothetical protein
MKVDFKLVNTWPSNHEDNKTMSQSFGELNGSWIFELKYRVVSATPIVKIHRLE